MTTRNKQPRTEHIEEGINLITDWASTDGVERSQVLNLSKMALGLAAWMGAPDDLSPPESRAGGALLAAYQMGRTAESVQARALGNRIDELERQLAIMTRQKGRNSPTDAKK